MNVHYFDWAATTPIHELALQAYAQSARTYRGNPSSLHTEGKDAARFLATQRQMTASLLNVRPRQIVYTSGATESNAIVLESLLWKRTPGKVVMSSLEHDSVLQYRRLLEKMGFEVVMVNAPGGYVDVQKLASAIDEKTQMVCLMLVSNVLGTVQDLASVSRMLREHHAKTNRKVHLHCDAVQAVGKIPLDLPALGVDSASFSAHKFGGPRGTGILYLAGDTVEPLSKGGGQEFGLRAGTEHVAAIAAMNAALSETLAHAEDSLLRGIRLRQVLEERLSHHDGITLLSPAITSDARTSPFILTISAKGVPSEVLTRVLYDEGFCVSSGSACSNNTPGKKNHLLVAAGFTPDAAACAIRISFGPSSTEDDIMELAEAIGREAAHLQKVTRKH